MKGKKVVSMLSLAMAAILTMQMCVTEVGATSLEELVSAQDVELGEAVAEDVADVEETVIEDTIISLNSIDESLQTEAT